MQLDLPLSSTDAQVQFVRHRRARRYIIRVLADGSVRVTLPRWGARREAVAFLERSRKWIADQQAHRAREQQACRRWRHGTEVLVAGAPQPVSVTSADGNVVIRLGDAIVAHATHLDPADVRAPIERWLRARAVAELGPRLMALARAHDVHVVRVSIRDQQSRWGACSPRGAITLNWRLVQVPPFVRDYVLLHELMHRRELNHSRRFWRHVAAVCPEYREARRWLLARGRELF